MALETMVHGLKALVLAVVQGETDVKVAAGALD
jgi:hypothetical protein